VRSEHILLFTALCFLVTHAVAFWPLLSSDCKFNFVCHIFYLIPTFFTLKQRLNIICVRLCIAKDLYV
jgi:hypothetical protein